MNKKILTSILSVSTLLFSLYIPSVGINAVTYGATINNIRIEKQYIDKNYSKNIANNPEYIVIHDTDNRDLGADAKANRDYFSTTKTKASAHYLIDEDSIIQALDDSWIGWHAGETQNPKVGNSNSIAIELCVNKDNDLNATLKNGIELTKYLMEQYNISAENVIRHNDVTGKICPRIMIEDNPEIWTYFKSSISSSSYENANTFVLKESDVNTSLKNETTSDNIPKNSSSTKQHNNKDNASKSNFKGNAKIKNVKSNLNVRISPSKNSKSIGQLNNNQSIKIVDSTGSWHKIQFKTNNGVKTGYVHSNYISIR